MTENRVGGAQGASPVGWQDWRRWVDGVDWSDWRAWLQRVADTDWAAGPWAGAPWEQPPRADEIPLTLRAFAEDEPGDQIRDHLAVAWPALVSAQARPRPEWSRGHRLRVKIDSSPQQAAIYIDSRDYGIQGYTPSELKLPRGTYRIILELTGFKPEEQILTISRSQAFAFTLVKQARPAILDVRAATEVEDLRETQVGLRLVVAAAAVHRLAVADLLDRHLLELRLRRVE